MDFVVAVATILLQQAPSPVPPPTEQITANCARPTYATEHLICETPVLLEAEYHLAELLRRADGLYVPGTWFERQEDWFRRRAMCASREDHSTCVDIANSDRMAILEAVTELPPHALRLVCSGADGTYRIAFSPDRSLALGWTSDGLVLAATTAGTVWSPFVTITNEGSQLVRYDGQIIHCTSLQSGGSSDAVQTANSPSIATSIDNSLELQAAPQPTSFPQIDIDAIIARLFPGTTIQVLGFADSDETTISGEVNGYEAPAYAVPVRSGQTLSVTFKPSNANLYMNVLDMNVPDVAVHRGDVDGEQASFHSERDSVYVIQLYQFRATARRGVSGSYTLSISRTTR